MSSENAKNVPSKGTFSAVRVTFVQPVATCRRPGSQTGSHYGELSFVTDEHWKNAVVATSASGITITNCPFNAYDLFVPWDNVKAFWFEHK
jgi:hypothetical protein